MEPRGSGLPDRSTETEAVEDDRDPVEALADEFIARRRRGETPSLEEYAARCPERADEIRELFPAIAAMERWKPRPVPPRDRPGGRPIRERLGEYRLIREIGRGGMGIVYEAEQESLGRRVAVKVLPGANWSDDRPMQRFLREARTAAGLRHGNIVPVFAIGREDDLHYYVMPLIRGAGLDRLIIELRERKIASTDGELPVDDDVLNIARTLLDRSIAGLSAVGKGPSSGSGLGGRSDSPTSDPFSAQAPRQPRGNETGLRHWRGIADIGRQVAEALQHAHDQGILHRDIKPANLLLDADGVVWVTDFGLAKAMSDNDLSRTGDLVGTLRYMAPERFKGRYDARSDIYSLGLTLYELATLRPAYNSADRAELIRMIAEAVPCLPLALDPSIPLDLETVILKAIDPDPSRRYASAADLAEDLARFVEGRSVKARRAAAPERLARWIGQNRATAGLAVTSVTLVLFAAYFVRFYLNVPPPPAPAEPRPEAKAVAPADDEKPLTPAFDDFWPPPPPRDGFGPPPPRHPGDGFGPPPPRHPGDGFGPPPPRFPGDGFGPPPPRFPGDGFGPPPPPPRRPRD